MLRLSRLFIVMVSVWVIGAPVVWWHSLLNRYDVPISWEFMAQLAGLAALALLALPALWSGVRWAAWATMGAVLGIELSMFAFPAALPNGLLMNGVLLCLAAGVSLTMSERPPGVTSRQP